MDLSWSRPQQELRADVRGWLRRNRTWGDDGIPTFEDLRDEVAWLREWQARLAEGSWVAVAWPEEYGGRGLGAAEHFLVQEELARAGSPEIVGRIGLNLAGPTLLGHGTPDQRARWLPRIPPAEDLWCQLFSEPEAGSDLAGLQTRAERVDGGWRVTGRKVWTSYAQFADWGLCLARTDPEARKHRGITYLVVDMHSPGITIEPIVQMTGAAEFNEVLLEDVFVPDDQVIGEVNAGWRVTTSTLSHERGVNPRQLVKHLQLVDELLMLGHAKGAFDDVRLAELVARSYMDIRIFQLHNWRSLSRVARSAEPGPEGSVLKLFWSERSQRFHDTALEVLDESGPLWRGADDNPGDGRWQESHLYYRSATIFAGTSEIQRNILAERVLGLPRGDR